MNNLVDFIFTFLCVDHFVNKWDYTLYMYSFLVIFLFISIIILIYIVRLFFIDYVSDLLFFFLFFIYFFFIYDQDNFFVLFNYYYQVLTLLWSLSFIYCIYTERWIFILLINLLFKIMLMYFVLSLFVPAIGTIGMLCFYFSCFIDLVLTIFYVLTFK